jgi:hypothetical protein
MARVLHVAPLSGERWVVSHDDDTLPISEHRTRGEAETSARAHAQTFGFPDVIVHGQDGHEERIAILDPDPQPDPRRPPPGAGAPAG